MFVIEEGNVIKLTRGDTFVSQVSITKNEATYVPQTGDVIKFYLKRNIMDITKSRFLDKTPLVTKTIPNDTLLLELEPSDTKELPFGEYVYDIELTYANGEVDTFINDVQFVLLPEVG